MDLNLYFKNIAENHKSIRHSEQLPAYFREYSSSKIIFGMSDFLSKMGNAKDVILVSQFNNDGNYAGPNHDTWRKDITGTVYLLKRADSDTIDQANSDVYSIWQDILAKMQVDNDDPDLPLGNGEFNFRDFYVYTLGMVADSFFGIAIFMTYKDFSDGACLVYDSDQWLDT
jgi:hypothetical protein